MSGVEAVSETKAVGVLARYLAPFAVAFAVFVGAFLLLDLAVMSLQGLSLFFSH